MSAPRTPARRRARVLPVVAGILAVSALLRLGGAAGEALAEAPAPDTPLDVAPERGEGTGGLLEALAARESRVAAREAEAERQEGEIEALREDLAAQVAALDAAEAALSDTLAQADGAAEADLARLASVYESMKPKDAAALFAAMDPAFSAGFLGLMQPEGAAAIMTNLDPEAAYAISAVLAGRNAQAPTE